MSSTISGAVTMVIEMDSLDDMTQEQMLVMIEKVNLRRRGEAKRRAEEERARRAAEYIAELDSLPWPAGTVRRYRSLVADAGPRGLLVTLTLGQFGGVLGDLTCHYCGCAIGESSCGVDRKDPSGDYTPENTVAACTGCNKAKLTHSYETWKAMADAFVEKHGRGKMWPTATHPNTMTDERRARAESYKVGRGTALGIQALALWACKVADPADRRMTFRPYRPKPWLTERAQQRAEARRQERAPIDVARALAEVGIEPRVRQRRGGFFWRGTWRPAK